MSRILVVDDERRERTAFERMLRSEGYEVVACSNPTKAFAHLDNESVDAVILEVSSAGQGGLKALRRIRLSHPKLPVIVMTDRGTTETAIEATKLGAFDYQVKPVEPERLLQTVEKAVEGARIMREYVALGRPNRPVAADAIVGRGNAMQTVFKAIGRVAQTDATVLIRGESGSGKELVARAIYQHSLRSDMPLSVINCAAIPEALLESELFGHEKGAFTGATSQRIGRFEQADGGTVFLDEIGDMPLGIQGKILRVLQQKEFERLGGNETRRVDVRILTATNRDLEIAIAEGNFREDLYHRLNVVTIHVPPLCHRREDIPDLIDYFLDRYARELRIERPPISAAALDALRDYSWPGNVRELEHCIERAVIYSRGRPIQAADLPMVLELERGRPSGERMGEDDDPLNDTVRFYLNKYAGDRACERLLETAEKLLLAEALRRTGGNQTSAAKLLGLARPTLHAKLRKYGLL